MSQAAGDPAHRLEFLCLEQLRLAFFERLLGPPAMQLPIPQPQRGHRDQGPPGHQDAHEQQPRAVAVARPSVLEDGFERFRPRQDPAEDRVVLDVQGRADADRQLALETPAPQLGKAMELLDLALELHRLNAQAAVVQDFEIRLLRPRQPLSEHRADECQRALDAPSDLVDVDLVAADVLFEPEMRDGDVALDLLHRLDVGVVAHDRPLPELIGADQHGDRQQSDRQHRQRQPVAVGGDGLSTSGRRAADGAHERSLRSM